MSHNPKAPDTPVVFTEMENIENNKNIAIIQQTFLKNHVEITSPSNSSLEAMMRDGKMMYANLGVQFAVQFLAAKRKQEQK